jgi:hypothetical protein
VAANFRRITLGVIVIFLTSALIAPGSASELSDAEKRYSDLQLNFEVAQGNLFLLLPGYEAEAQVCIERLASATNSTDISARTAGQQELTRLQLERATQKNQIEAMKIELTSLELRIQSLKSTSSSATSSGSTSSASTGAATSDAQTSPSAPVDSTPTTSSSQVAPIIPDAPAPVQSSPTPRQSPSSAAQSGNTSATATPVVTNKVTPSPKPKAKKKTITCTKGKVSRKVTAVKPVCPKGFKLKTKK